MKNKRFRRVLSIVLSAAMLCTMAIQGVGFAAASSYEKPTENLVVDPGFDLPNGFVTDNSVGRWNNWEVSKSDAGRSGSCVKFSATESSLQYNVDGSTLQVGSTYTFSIWAKVESGDNILQIGVKNYGGSEIYVSAAGNDWMQYSVSFTYLSGNPVLYAYNNTWINGTAAVAYVDDASLVVQSDISSAHIENGSITVSGSNLDMSAFSAVYSTNLNPESKTLALNPSGDVLSFDPIPALPVEQTVTVTLSYRSERITLRYTIAADDTLELVPTEIASVSAENGTVTVTLAEEPTIEPTAKDFAFTMAVDGVKTAFVSRSFTYDMGRTITVEFDPVSASLGGSKNVEITVACGGSTGSASFTVAQGTSRSYYVSSSAGAGGDGSQGAPFNSIAQLNAVTFQPGDHIYFKSGETFTGMFRPQGSGQEGAPIVVGSYGGTERPIITPDYSQSFSFVLGANDWQSRQVNGAIWLENVEYWEIRDLELKGSTYSDTDHAVNNLTLFDAGIRVVNMDSGDLSHFVFDNLVIHGFRGPGSNIGKTSGGIQFNVGAKSSNPDEAVRSCFVDVSVTNCEIYQCGRSGINTLSVWGFRQYLDNGSTWPSFPNEYRQGYHYYPNRNFYMANCNIHDIDGDGLIVDTWSNAVVENNTVYNCAIHLGAMKAAVGLFNWNSDNTVFQYNECYGNGLNATWQNGNGAVESGIISQDGQGIEVDALNQNTWVQYNYLHDNSCFMMLCTFSATYRSYNTTIRYNVSENEGYGENKHISPMGYFYIGGFGFNTEVYNNTLVLNENTLRNGSIYLLTLNGNSSVFKFYNNIFYYAGGGTAAVTNWYPQATDFRNNLFINISNAPTDNNNISLNYAEGLFVGGEGPDAYQLADASYDNAGANLVSMNDGMFSGVDFAGAPLSGAPGIGAFQSAN